MTLIRAVAHTNIALIKYWGKKPGTGNLPAVGSLSLTLDQFYTTTTVEPAEVDSFTLDGHSDDSRVLAHIDYFRKLAGSNLRFKISSDNHVATASGLASSASGFAALTLALARAFSLDLSKKELSQTARIGSGSAARSIFGGFALMRAQEYDTFAEPIESSLTASLAMVVAECASGQKSVSSRDGMKRVMETSVFYDAFVANHASLLEQAVAALTAADLRSLGACMEQSTLQMHATTLGCADPFWYFNPTTLAVMSKTRSLRDEGIDCYFTMDAGPHVKVLCEVSKADGIAKELRSIAGVSQITICRAGPEAHLV